MRRHLVRCSHVLALALTGAGFFSSPAQSLAKKYPEPSVYPISWQLTFRHKAPHRIVVHVPGHSTPAAYWYMTYTVINSTGTDQYFVPSFDLVTQDGKVHRSDMALPREVFDTIKKREGNPLLKQSIDIEGKLLQGEDQAKDGVAIWEEPSGDMHSFTIFVSDLSGEFVIMKDDDGKPMKESDGSPVIVRKTLELDFAVRGSNGDDEVEAKPEKWVMR
jgi:hypothetical protein